MIFPEFLSFAYVISKLSILSNYTEHSKRLALYYILSCFIKSKSKVKKTKLSNAKF